MSNYKKEDVRARGLEKLREASVWWSTHEKALDEWRWWNVYMVAHRYAMHEAKRLGSHGLAKHLQACVDLAHDMRLSAQENVMMSADCARACEIGARIYMEEYEEREQGADQ